MRVIIIAAVLGLIGLALYFISQRQSGKAPRVPSENKQGYPKDSDGDSLRGVAQSGSDMSKPMEIDYMIAVPNSAVGQKVAAAAATLGYATKVEQDDDSKSWTCYCTKKMLATYEGVVHAQKELDDLARPLGGHIDGWGTFGNKE